MNNKRLLVVLSFICAAAANGVAHSSEQSVPVMAFRHLGPVPVLQPIATDSVDLQTKPFDVKSLLKTPLRLDAIADAPVTTDSLLVLDAPAQTDALHLVGFSLVNASFVKAAIDVRGCQNFELYIDGQSHRSGESLELLPAAHEVVLKSLTTAGATDTLRISVKTEQPQRLALSASADADRLYTLEELFRNWHFTQAALSPNGQMAIVSRYNYTPSGKTSYRYEVRDIKSGRVMETTSGLRWMPHTNSYLLTRTATDGRKELLCVDPQTHAETLLTSDLPEGSWVMLPNERQLLYTLYDDGQKETDSDVHEIVHPDDRQPGWRKRSRLALYDLESGLMRPLTSGYNSIYLQDISQDSRYLLFSKHENDIAQMRPTEFTSLFRLSLEDMRVDTLVWRDGFLEGATFSPDGRQVLLTGSPEALNGIGNVVPAGRVPSAIDRQLFLMELDEPSSAAGGMVRRATRPLTRDFNPSVNQVEWSTADGLIYLTAEDKDCVHLFCLNPKRGTFRLIDAKEDLVNRFSLAADAPVLMYAGQSASNPDRLYTLSTRTMKATLFDAPNARQYSRIRLGDCQGWTFVNPKGDSICCRFYLPPTFDVSKRYPMIVNYYGGCSPSSRHFDSRYPHHVYAGQGYVVLVINPSGATGFGQEFSSRHVNTAGEGVAEDIIGAVKAFCHEHKWVNDKKIGCIGASYGGFMTQYLQTKTDLFAAAISHAGISDHTSYWGEGYWGYSYSQISMGGSYPWTRRDLYVEQSPLFNADKIHTPLLFLHGAADTNVPVGESIQMYTALKLLGRPTALVLVEGENHHILEYQKRKRWQQTIDAWFARWLKDEPEWWQALYPDKKL